MDLSNYMLAHHYATDPESAVTMASGLDDWDNRYVKYIPGYKWLDEADWAVTPGRCEPDLNVKPTVYRGGVFVIGAISTTSISGYPWWASDACDIDLRNRNPWGEEVNSNSIGRTWSNGSWFLYKILNDSIKLGLKAANDPADFEVIDTWSMGVDTEAVIGGRRMNADNQTVSYIRKPEIYRGNPVITGSFGTIEDNGTRKQDGTSEWICLDRHTGNEKGYTWPMDVLYITRDLGQHHMFDVTHYLSTVSSNAYIVSPGYSMEEEIRGVVTGVTVSDFLANIDKKNADQLLTVISDGAALPSDAVVTQGDSLVVVSADSTNTTRYLLDVTDDGLSDDAMLTSATLDVSVTGVTGTVGGFDYGTSLKEVLWEVAVPTGARMDIIDDEGAYVPRKKLHYDTVYVETQVSEMIYFEVTAEDGATKITYQLTPNSDSADAFVVSDIYDVDQENYHIAYITSGISVSAFYQNLIPVSKATMQVVDKYGLDRSDGPMYSDDLLIVTAGDGVTKSTYFLDFFNEKNRDRLPVADVGEDFEICSGDSVILNLEVNPEEEYTISWNNDVINGVPFIPLTTAGYIVTVTNPHGSDTDTIVVTVNTVDTSVTVLSNSLAANATDVEYQWINCSDDTPIDGATARAYLPKVNGIYAVEITQNGCVKRSSCYEITITGANENRNKNDILFYPNPVEDYLIIELDGVNYETTIEIWDITGRMVLNKRYYQSKNIEVDMKMLVEGVYLLKLSNQSYSVTKKIIKSI